MALWQISFFILPHKSLESLPFFKDASKCFDDGDYWSAEKTPVNSFDVLNDILPKGKSWSNSIIAFGNLESNVVEILCGDTVISVSFRIDFTFDFENILRGIIEFCKLNGFVIIDSQHLSLLPLDYATIEQFIKDSPQVVAFNKLSKSSEI